MVVEGSFLLTDILVHLDFCLNRLGKLILSFKNWELKQELLKLGWSRWTELDSQLLLSRTKKNIQKLQKGTNGDAIYQSYVNSTSELYKLSDSLVLQKRWHACLRLHCCQSLELYETSGFLLLQKNSGWCVMRWPYGASSELHRSYIA